MGGSQPHFDLYIYVEETDLREFFLILPEVWKQTKKDNCWQFQDIPRCQKPLVFLLERPMQDGWLAGELVWVKENGDSCCIANIFVFLLSVYFPGYITSQYTQVYTSPKTL